MTLSPELIAEYKRLLLNPIEGNLPIMPIKEFFTKSEIVTPLNVLAKAYMDHVGSGLPKMILYIVMFDIYGHPKDKAENGSAGYYLTTPNYL